MPKINRLLLKEQHGDTRLSSLRVYAVGKYRTRVSLNYYEMSSGK